MLRQVYLGTLGGSVAVLLSILSCTSADSQSMQKALSDEGPSKAFTDEAQLLGTNDIIFLEGLAWVSDEFEVFVRTPWRPQSKFTEAKTWTDDVAWVYVSYELKDCSDEGCKNPRYLNLKIPKSEDVSKEMTINMVREDNSKFESKVFIGEKFKFSRAVSPGQAHEASPRLLEGLTVLAEIVFDFRYFIRSSFAESNLNETHSLFYPSNPIEWTFVSKVFHGKQGPKDFEVGWGLSGRSNQLHASLFENSSDDKNLSFIDVSLRIKDSWMKKYTHYVARK